MDYLRLAQPGQVAAHKGGLAHNDSRKRTCKGHQGRREIMLDRPLPASVDIERSILGAILLDNKAYSEASGELRPEDFSLDSHRRIWLRMVELAESSWPIDMI